MKSWFRKRWVIASLASLGIVVVTAVLWLTVWVDCVVTASQSHSFQVDVPFDRFRKIMVRTDASKQIIDKSGMELVDKKLLGVGLRIAPKKTGRPLRDLIEAAKDYDLEASGTMQVRPNDPYLDGEVLQMNQRARIRPDSLDAVTSLAQPGNRLQDYSTRLLASGDENRSEIAITVDMTVKAETPWLLDGIVREQVQQAVTTGLKQQESVLRDLIEQRRDDFLILPNL